MPPWLFKVCSYVCVECVVVPRSLLSLCSNVCGPVCRTGQISNPAEDAHCGASSSATTLHAGVHKHAGGMTSEAHNSLRGAYLRAKQKREGCTVHTAA